MFDSWANLFFIAWHKSASIDTHTTDLPTPKYFSQYSKQPMSVLSKFWQAFCGCTTDESKQNSVKSQFFYHLSCKNSVWTHIFNDTDALHSDNFSLFTSAKVVLDRRPQKISPKIMHSVCCFCWYQCIFSWMVVVLVGVCFLGFVHSSSSLSVSCSHLIPTALNSNLPYRKMATFHKVLMQSRCSLVQQTFLTNQDWLDTSGPEMAWNMQISRNDNFPFMLATNLHLFTSRFLYFLENSCVHILRNTVVHPYCWPISVLIRSNTDG